jgi:DNA-binding NarL/FixJ family response regulator
MISIIVADDHSIVREGLVRILAEQPEIRVVGEAQNAAELLALLNRQACDVLILDITMPGRDGLDVLKETKARWPAIAVLMLTMHPEEQYAVRAFRAGAAGYVTKDSAPAELVKAIQSIVSRGRYVPPSLADKLVAFLQTGASEQPHEKLSDREFEVLRKLASGRTVNETAEELFLSPSTVSTCRSGLLEKLNLRTTADLILYAVTHKLVN